MADTIGRRQHLILAEALRRYTRFHNGKEPITTQWTGLALRGEAASVTDCARPLMEWVHSRPAAKAAGWLRLTERGANIVRQWLKAGFTYEDVEGGNLPPIPSEA